MGGWEKNKSFRKNIFFVEERGSQKNKVWSRHEFTHGDMLDFYDASAKKKKKSIIQKN